MANDPGAPHGAAMAAGNPYVAMHEALERQARVLAETIQSLEVFDKGLTDAMGSLIRTIQNLKPLVPEALVANGHELDHEQLADMLDAINARIDELAARRADDLAARRVDASAGADGTRHLDPQRPAA